MKSCFHSRILSETKINVTLQVKLERFDLLHIDEVPFVEIFVELSRKISHFFILYVRNCPLLFDGLELLGRLESV